MIVGIDLGTTHSLVGVHDAIGGTLFQNAFGHLLTPSVVGVDDDGSILVGEAARERLVSHPSHTVAAFKRWMGTSRETRLGGRGFRPEELSALVLRALIADAEAATGQKVTEAVISVPAYFSDAQRKATRVAGELAGIRVERLVNEPTAAALAYGLQQPGREGRVIVLDLGGGTFDVSILELFEGVVEVHASAGDNFLGGEDFLGILLDAFLADQKLSASELSPHERAILGRRGEQLKRALSGTLARSMQVEIAGRPLSWEIDEARFSALAEPLLQRMRAPIERAMRDARLIPEDLDEIILVGGASRMPMVSRLVTRMFGRLPLRHVNPDEAIALGAVAAAGLKARDESLRETVLTDVCPYTLGTDVARVDGDGRFHGGFFNPIIPRNCVVPVSRVDVLQPVQEGQRTLVLGIYQGESPLVANNIKLGEITIDLDPLRPRQEQHVEVRFTYDVNGLLQIEVTERRTGHRHELVLQQTPGLIDPGEIRRRLEALAELKVHPRDQQQNRALLARGERLYEEQLHTRPYVQDLLAIFRMALESQDPRMIEARRGQLVAALDELEGLA